MAFSRNLPVWSCHGVRKLPEAELILSGACEIPVQSPRSITKSKGSVRLDCDLKGVYRDLRDITVHWYQQKPNDAPERILYHAGAKVVDGGFQAHRYTVEKFPSQKLCILTIKDITPDDAATYYCAYWYSHCGRMSEITKTNTPSASQPQTT
uniref:Ig-like domain-containing protein n=1 Tax=Falco tinnunculus TaxID=100819 RepID=A0A8C4XLJ7_FALTI